MHMQLQLIEYMSCGLFKHRVSAVAQEAKRANEKVLDSGSILTTTGPNVFKEVFTRWVEYVRPGPPYGGGYMVSHPACLVAM